MRLCADSMTRVTMELGGHAPVLIFDDCDLEKTLDMVVPQKFRNAGQVCVSPTRFYVQRGIYDAFIKGFAERTAKVKVGNGLEEGIRMGPLANRRRPDAIGAAGRGRQDARRARRSRAVERRAKAASSSSRRFSPMSPPKPRS